MPRRQRQHGFSAIRVQGGILPPEFLQEIAALEAPSQAGQDYDISKSLNVKDEIGRYWRIASDLWNDYRDNRDRVDVDTKKVGVERWLHGFLRDVFGYDEIIPTGLIKIGERDFPVNGKTANGAVPLVLTTRDFDLDKAETRFGQEGRRRSPHHRSCNDAI